MKKNIIILLILNSIFSFANVHIGINQQYSRIELAFRDNAIHPSDTVYLHAGFYTGYNGIVGLKGSPNKWIVFTKFENDSVSIAGNWQFQACEYIKIYNLDFKATAQSPGRLINVDNNGSCNTQSKFIIFDKCSFADVTEPNSICSFKFGGVDNFEVTNCIFKNMPVCDAFDFNVCHNGIISGNRIENCLSGGHIKGGASDIVMERNTFINASSGAWVAFELGGDTGAQFYCPDDKFEVKNLKFYSNLVIGGYRGVALSSAVDCKIINNTFYNCGQATLRFLNTSSLYPNLNGNRVENNIFAFGTSAYMNGSLQPVNAVSFSKNIYYHINTDPFNGPYWDTPELDLVKDKSPINIGANTQIFVNGKNNDFNLTPNSPAIASGTIETEPLLDYYGKPFSKSKRSIGAIEFNYPLNMSISTDSIIFNTNLKSSNTFSINSNTSWNITSNQDWLSFDNVNGVNDGTVLLSASENKSTYKRNDTITISGLGINKKYIYVSQEANKTEVELINSEEFQIYPNPANQYIDVSNLKPLSKIELYNPLGIKLHEFDNMTKLDISILSNGLYFIKADNRLFKFIKK